MTLKRLTWPLLLRWFNQTLAFFMSERNLKLVLFFKVVRAVCCIGVAHDYFSKRKYNLVELVRPEEGAEEVKQENSVETNTEQSDGQVKSGEEVLQSGGEAKQLDQSKTDCVVETSENNGTPSDGEVVTNTSEPLSVT